METYKTDAVQEVSSITSNDIVKEDDHPLKAMPCQLPPKELSPGSFALPCTVGSFNLYAMADLGTCVNIMLNSVFEYLKLTNLRKTDMLVGMANMTQQAPLGTLENVLVKIDKFVFSYDFVVIDMPGILGEMMVLDRPFLATIHAKINEEESFNPLKLGDDLFSYESPACLRFEQNTRIYMNSNIETIDSPSNMQETRKKGYVLDDVWEKCEQNHRGTKYAWHDEGHEEGELWKSGIEKIEYEPPMVNAETFEVKRVKWKNRSLDASFVAMLACMLSTMLRKSLRTIRFWNLDRFGKECSYRLLGVGAVFSSILMDDDASSSKRFIEWFYHSPNGATSHGGGLDKQSEQRKDRLQECY
ncbi:calcium load-activated calcium channel-like protein [Tanacetum coccineum]